MTAPALDIIGLSKKFGGVYAADEISFRVEPNSITALIGPNGAGKTTIFNLITKVIEADRGEILLYGQSLRRVSLPALAGLGLIRTFQSARVFSGMTVLQNVVTGGYIHARSHPLLQALRLPGAAKEEHALTAKAEALLDLAGLSRFRDAPATELPMGSQKMVEILRALMASPRLLLLDEPAAGLNDSETAQLADLIGAIRAYGITVMIVEHNMSLVMAIADRVLVLEAGKMLASGTPREIQADPLVIQAYLGKVGADAAA